MTGGAVTTVLYVIVYPYRMAGANRSLLELVTQLPPSVRPLVVLTDEGRAAQAFRAAGVETHVLALTGELNRHGGHLRSIGALRGAWIALSELAPFTLRLRRFIRRHGVDLVHANDARGVVVAGPAAALAGRPLVMHLRGELTFHGAARFLAERLPARIIAVSRAARRTLSPAAPWSTTASARRRPRGAGARGCSRCASAGWPSSPASPRWSPTRATPA
jgi:hypothetical protein